MAGAEALRKRLTWQYERQWGELEDRGQEVFTLKIIGKAISQ
ncbi:hypothetical protein QE382_004004 [Sphingobacterium zeae]|uniref:Uncharacterized protein n=1 Tax=Sphingobacterium zeae TaxID=1776859 RepID=A0ABU0UB04_9SPHI|nr:hypothetical protein [Sphingobacterium zeae]